MSLTTPNTIRTLQRKLYAKAKQEDVGLFKVPTTAGWTSAHASA